MLKSFFENEKIEYSAVIPYSSCREISHDIMAREEFAPKSVILFLIPYYGGECVNLSRYAAARDYHLYIRYINEKLISYLSQMYPESSSKGYGDHSPIDERHAALIAGLGMLGDNGLLINPKYGSYVFIADVISDIEPEKLQKDITTYPVSHCEGCGACKAACPTGILRGCGSDCLSAVTQRKAELSEEEINLMKKYNTVWGCDECQSSCPHNKNPKYSPIEFFSEDRIPMLTSDILSKMTEEEFKSRAFAWRRRKTIQRNLEYLEY